MAVVAKWMCDRDNTMFDSKKEADEYDKMLELTEQLTLLMQTHIPDVDETRAEEFGVFLARNKDVLVQACKGKVEALDTLINPQADGADNVTPIAAEG